MKRLENGLIEGINYIKDENNKINWLKILPVKYLYIKSDPKNRERIEKKYGKKIEDLKIDEDKIDDSDLIITLPGIRYLLDVRGYKSSEIRLDACNAEYAAATCKIIFIANEDENFEQTFTANACAHQNNNFSFMKQFLVESCSNRAFCRAVRSYLGINIISREELGVDSKSEEDNSNTNGDDLQKHIDTLKTLMIEKNIDFEKVKARLIASGIEGAENFKSVQDLPKSQVFDMLEKVKKAKKVV